MSPYTADTAELLKFLETDGKNGLDPKKLEELRQKYGPNRLREKKRKSMLSRFIDQFKDVMILILIAAAVISFTVACVEGDPKGFIEPLLILAIVIVNAIIGMLQESKAEKALEALKNLSAPHARVIRGGIEAVIDASDLLPGDLIRLEAGDFIPADARLIATSALKCEESALTGESVPSEKDASAEVEENAPLGDRTNMVFSGCSVSYGSGLAVVCATGMNTEMGKIAGLLESADDGPTPLQQKLASMGKYLGFVALVACAVIFIIGLASGINAIEIFMTAVSLAVSAIPEGLPAIVTIVLSIGVQRLVKKNAIIRRLPAVETLGSASVICSDKTGTLTQNRMTLVKAYTPGDGLCDIGAGKVTDGSATEKLLMYGMLCCDGTVIYNESGKEEHIGDPTETAIVAAAHTAGTDIEKAKAEHPRLFSLPFDSDRKLMSVVCEAEGKKILIVKGAFDVMLSRCAGSEAADAARYCDEMSRAALRVLAVAYKEIDTVPTNPKPEELENGLTFMGLVGMIDPPRPEAKAAVAVCRRAGIKPVMITGDHVVTASAIAAELGILEKGDLAITGAELDAMTDSELDGKIDRISVYARVSPENKIRIVRAWQRRGQVVSMTGDGVNDAPALKAADIGCAMGITGTDVAKGAADMTLTDDNFATIVDAVREGRGIYANIKKVVGFLLGTNIGEVITVFVAMLLWHKTPLLSMQLLWINLVTDGLPAVALGMEAVESDVMNSKPKPKNEGIFAHGFGLRIILQGVMFGALSLAAYVIGERMTGSESGGQTLAFMVLALSQIVQSYNMRSEHSLFRIGFFGNRILNKAAAVSVALMAIVLFTPVSSLFGLIILPWYLYLIGLGLIIVPFIVMEISKAVGLIKHHH